MKFADVPGNPSLKASLVHAIDSGHIAHAQLFAGTEGGTGLMLALAYAQYLNCENRTEGDSCGTCVSCIKTQKFIHPDLHFCFPWAKTKLFKEEEINAFLPLWRSFLTESPFARLSEWAEKCEFENRTPFINIKTIREAMLGLQLKPYEATYKVQIIWLPETLRTDGANSFLKSLEEPPPFTVFLLVSTQPEQLLPTVISRTQRVTIPRLEEAELAAYLVSHFGVPERKAAAVASLADGSIPEALFLVDEKEDDYHNLFLEWQRACFMYDVQKLIQFTNAFVELGKELQKSYLRFSMGKLRSAMVLSAGAPSVVRIPEKEAGELGRFGKVFSLPLMELMAQELDEAYRHIDRNASGRMVFLDLSLKLATGYSKYAVRASR